MKRLATFCIFALSLFAIGCTEKVLVLPLENDIPSQDYNITYLQMLKEFKHYRFKEAPFTPPNKSYRSWSDAEYATVAKEAQKAGAIGITFGQVQQGKGYIGFLPATGAKRADAEFYLISIHHWKGMRQWQIRKALENIPRD